MPLFLAIIHIKSREQRIMGPTILSFIFYLFSLKPSPSESVGILDFPVPDDICKYQKSAN